MFDQKELANASLSQLGVLLLDATDNALISDDLESIEPIHKEIGQEVLRRLRNGDDANDVTKVRHMMDFHYKKWADFTEKNIDGVIEAYHEFRAMMTGFVEVNEPAETIDDRLD